MFPITPLDSNIFLDSDTQAFEISDEEASEDYTISSHSESEDIGTSACMVSSSIGGGGQESGEGMLKKLEQVLDAMDGVGLNLADVLYAVSWGDPQCIASARVRAQRTALFKSKRLPVILKHWYKPPRAPGSHSKRPVSAAGVLEPFSFGCVASVLEKELESLSSSFHSPHGNDVVETELTDASTFSGTMEVIKDTAPNIWRLLLSLAYSKKQLTQNTHKKPEKVVLMIISILSYTRSHHRGRFQKLFAIYFKFRGLTAKGFDTLHALGLTMSHKWTCNAVSRISDMAMKEVVELMGKFPWTLSYDNVLVPFRVFSQRLDNQSDLGNGTAATVYIKRNATPLPPTINRCLQETRAEGMKKPLTEFDLHELASGAYPQIALHMKYQVLQILFNAPDFEYHSYSHRNSPLLSPPTPIDQLPSGPDSITLQYLLGSLNIPEASYEDNSRLITEWLKQIEWGTQERAEKLGLQDIMVWIGDQLTVDRLRHLFKFRAGDLNSYDRLDWLVPMFGWLHLMMAYAGTLHKQYLGTGKGRGLSHAFDLLNKKGLGVVATKGTFYRDLTDTIHHVTEAHIRQEWLSITGVDSLHDLHNRSAEDLVYIASKIVEERASSAALWDIDVKPAEQQDALRRQVIMWNRDSLQYITLQNGMKMGDVGLMESYLPLLFFRFIGGKNSHYANEVLELLQALHREWPLELKTFVREHCWLLNNTGKPNGWLAFDEAQEMNIKDIKVTHRSEGPNVDWDYLKKLHPAIHIIRAVGVHVEKEFNTLARGKKHTVPQKELDVKSLQSSYAASNIHTYIPGRKISNRNDEAKDFVTAGIDTVMEGRTLKQWVSSRTFARNTTQDWSMSDTNDDYE